MKNKSYALFFLLLILMLASCASHRKYTFSTLDSLHSLNGTYVNRAGYITQAFNIRKNYIDLVRLEFAASDTLNVYCLTDTGYVHFVSRKGKLNKKKNYFEIVLEKNRAIFLLMNGISNDKVRMGVDSSGKLFLNKQYDSFGNFFILMGAYDYDFGESMEMLSDTVLRPVRKDGKWGYARADGSIEIEPQYDFVRLFEGNVARVQVDKKWGLINRAGEEVAPAIYTNIGDFEEQKTTRAYRGEKEGFIGRDGKEAVPVIYDRIDYMSSGDSIGRSRLDGRYGYVSRTGVIVPPVFDGAEYIGTYYNHSYVKDIRKTLPNYIGEVVIEKKRYAIDDNGYIYNISDNIISKVRILLDSKRHWTEIYIPKGKDEEQMDIHRIVPATGQ